MPAVPSSLLEPVWVEFCALIGGIGRSLIRVTRWAATAGGSPTGSCSSTWSPHWCTARVRAHRHAGMFGPHDPTPGEVWAEHGHRPAGACPGAARLRPDDRPGAGRCGGGRVHHQGALRRGKRGALAGGPAQGRPETLGGHRGHGIPLGIVSAGANRHDSPLLAPTLQAAEQQLGGAAARGAHLHLDRGYDSGPTRDCSANSDSRPDRPQGHARPDPGRQALGGGAHARVDERLRQAPPDAPTATARSSTSTSTSPPRSSPSVNSSDAPEPLPLGHPPHHQTPQVNLLPGALSERRVRAHSTGPEDTFVIPDLVKPHRQHAAPADRNVDMRPVTILSIVGLNDERPLTELNASS